MSRVLRYFVPGQLWHITHRCHQRSFFLKFSQDRRRYLHWLLQAKKRFGLRVLNYVVTCNHVHLLVKETEPGVMARSMQLAAGRTAQEFNERTGRRGAFWEDRYHATAVEADEHLHRCLVYIDLNMVRAGAVAHPAEWEQGGYAEMQGASPRNLLIDVVELSTLCGFSAVPEFRAAYCHWIAQSLTGELPRREECWSSAVAVGGRTFVENVKRELNRIAWPEQIDGNRGTYVLRDLESDYAGSF